MGEDYGIMHQVLESDTFLSKIPIAPCYCQMMG